MAIDSQARGLAASPVQLDKNWFSGVSMAALKTGLRTAALQGAPLWTRPYLTPTSWTAGETVKVGEVRKNSASPEQWYVAIAVGGVCGSTEPTQTNGSASWDGTANTSVLWTNLGIPAWEASDMTYKPTITLTGSTATPAGYNAFPPYENISSFTINGGNIIQSVPSGGFVITSFMSNASTTVQGAASVEFMSDAASIAIRTAASGNGFRVVVNGIPVSENAIYSNAADWYYAIIDFGSKASRHWEIHFGKDNAAFYGCAIKSVDLIWPVNRNVNIRGAFIGDSYLAGSAYGPYLLGNTLSVHFGRLAGIRDMWRFGTGGTGLIATGGGYYTYEQRLPQVLASNPGVIFVQGSTNDTPYTYSQIYTAALSFLDAIRAGTRAPVFWFGPAPISGSYSSIQTVDSAIAAACAARPNKNIFYKSMVTNVPPWFTGAWDNAGYTWSLNAANYIGGDNVHPVDKGTMYLAYRMYESYIYEMLPLMSMGQS